MPDIAVRVLPGWAESIETARGFEDQCEVLSAFVPIPRVLLDDPECDIVSGVLPAVRAELQRQITAYQEQQA